MRRIQLFLATAAILATTFIACQPYNTFDNDWQSVQDYTVAEQLFDDVYKQIDAEVQRGTNATQCSNVTFTYNADSTVADMVIDFGSSCMGNDNRRRSGRILAHITGHYRNINSVITVTFDNYYVDGSHIEGIETITNTGRNIDNRLTYNSQVTGARITDTDGTIITWESVHNSELMNGESTTFASDGESGITDDVYIIWGASTGVNRNGLAWSANIVAPLRRFSSCNWIINGSANVIQAGKTNRYLDFTYPVSSGTCDNTARAFIQDNQVDITLR